MLLQMGMQEAGSRHSLAIVGKNDLILGKVGDFLSSPWTQRTFWNWGKLQNFQPRILSKVHAIPDAVAGWRAQTVEREDDRQPGCVCVCSRARVRARARR